MLSDKDCAPKFFPKVTLPAGPVLTQYQFNVTGVALSLTTRNARGDKIRLQTEYSPDTTDRLGIWYGSETRVDSAGRFWQSSLPHHVVDDFGSLVAVPA